MNSAFSEQTYSTNLEILGKTDPLLVCQLEALNIPNLLTPCVTEKGEPNLCIKKYGITSYYHSRTQPKAEFEEMITEEVKSQGETLYVYGLGLGYIFDYLEEWLNDKSKKRALIFIEDDIEVIYYFLHTQKATEILNHPRTVLFYLRDFEVHHERFIGLITAFMSTKVDFTTLPLYLKKKRETAYLLCYMVLYNASTMEGVLKEFLSGQMGFYTNFYRNIFYLTSSYLGSGMFGKFKNVPAIICGAGPSIHKNIHVLQTLKDKAVIFAGGSSLNVLNHFGINPHFGVGVDPNKEQKHRLMANDSFHLPYLFRPRVSHEAFMLMQGPKIYIPGSVNPTAAWIEEQLGISIPSLDEGHNVVNLCTEIAHRMGMNPIIYIGMDLAFTEVQTYANGILTHPLWIDKSKPYNIARKESVNRKDIYGNPVQTKWDWIGEASWLSHFASNHPHLTIINATEGGLGFPPVPNSTLAAVKEVYLNKTYDLSGEIHTEIQNHPIQITTPQLLQHLTKLMNSMNQCLKCYKEIIQEKLIGMVYSGKKELEYDTVNTVLLESDIEGELAYLAFINPIENAFAYMQQIAKIYKKAKVLPYVERLARTKFLEACLLDHIKILVNAFQLYFVGTTANLKIHPRPTGKKEVPGIYRFENGQFHIQDEVNDIHIDINMPPELIERKTTHYENGQLKSECFYLENQLHGPTRFYSPSGQLLSESWYIKDCQEGKSTQYYASGALYSIRYFKNNLLHGPQDYYFENGQISVSMYYEGGFLEGEVNTYVESGQQLRQLHYRKGKRNGEEKIWNSNGQLVVECFYELGVPKGKAKEWTPTGWLFKEIEIYQFPDDFDAKMYSKEGQVVQSFERGFEDHTPMYEKADKKIKEVDDKINDLLSQLDKYVTTQAEKGVESTPELQQEIHNIKKAKEELDHLITILHKTKNDNLQQTETAKQIRREGKSKSE